MISYVPPPPDVAERIYRETRDSEEQRCRLEAASSEELKRVLLDRAESAAARSNAELLLLLRREPAMGELLPQLWEDPVLGRLAVQHCPLTDAATVERLRALLDHANLWSEASLRLARHRDEAIRPRLLEWWHSGDEAHRYVAIQALMVLDAATAGQLLRVRFDPAAADDTNIVWAAFLFQLGDARGLPLLQATAERATGARAVFAATALADYDALLGACLLLRIIDQGDLEARQHLVSHVWNRADLPHAFTADGIHEARAWIEQQICEAQAEKSEAS